MEQKETPKTPRFRYHLSAGRQRSNTSPSVVLAHDEKKKQEAPPRASLQTPMSTPRSSAQSFGVSAPSSARNSVVDEASLQLFQDVKSVGFFRKFLCILQVALLQETDSINDAWFVEHSKKLPTGRLRTVFFHLFSLEESMSKEEIKELYFWLKPYFVAKEVSAVSELYRQTCLFRLTAPDFW
jgi:hypothetical protein